MSKKLLTWILSLVLVVAMLPAAVMAAEAEADLVIKNAADLAAFAEAVNNGDDFEGKTVELAADIELTEAWTPIGNGSRSGCSVSGAVFKGIFNGQSKSISGLTVAEDASNAGLFGIVEGGTVKNLELTVEINAPAGDNVGGAVAVLCNDGIVEDVTVNGSVSGKAGVGGVVGRVLASGMIKSCVNNATVTQSGKSDGAGGIVGKAYYSRTDLQMYITNCENTGDVTSEYCAGGIAGLSAANVSDCTNSGTITAAVEAGGIVGEQVNQGRVSENENTGDVTNGDSMTGTAYGGIIGWIRYQTNTTDYEVSELIEVVGNTNTGTITAVAEGDANMASAGGIVGLIYNQANVSSNINEAKSITGKNFAAGVVGGLQPADNNQKLEGETITVSLNLSDTALENISASCKDLYAYNNSPGTFVVENNSNSEDGIVITLADFTAAIEAAAAGGDTAEFDGNGLTVKWSFDPDSAYYHAYSAKNGVAGQHRGLFGTFYGWKANTIANLNISNVNFVYETSEEAEAAGISVAELQLYSAGEITFRKCSFDGVTVSPWGYDADVCDEVYVSGCTFSNISGRSALHQVRAEVFTVKGCRFADCSSAIHYATTNAEKLSLISNTFDNCEVCFAFALEGSFSNTEVVMNENVTSGDTKGFLRVWTTAVPATAVNPETILANNPDIECDVYSELSKYAPVAQIDDAVYFTLQDAIDASAEGDTVTLLSGIELTAPVTVAAGQKVTLDLNGKTVSQTKECTGSYSMIENMGTLTIKDSSENGTGLITFTDTSAGDSEFNWGSYTLTNRGTLEIQSGTVEHLGQQNKPGNVVHMYCAVQQSAGTTTITGGTFRTPTYRSVRINAGNLTVQGGKFEGQIWVQPNQGAATIEIEDGSFAPSPGDASSVFLTNKGENNTVTSASISGGTFNGKVGITDSSLLSGFISGGIFTETAKEKTDAVLLAAGYCFADNGDGTYTVEKAFTGTGTKDDPYTISSLAGLKYLRDQVNSGKNYYAGQYFLQTANIDLAGENWTPIGSADQDHGFCGNFDGQTFEIQNLTITDPAKDIYGYVYAGLFGVTEGSEEDQTVIKNLTIKNVNISSDGDIVAAAVAYPYYTKLENITVYGDISITGGNYTAGVVAYTRRCTDASNLTITGSDDSTITGATTVGGVISDIQMNGGLTANYSNFNASGLTITGDSAVGGISGIISGQSLATCSVQDVALVCDKASVGIVSGSLGTPSTITDATVETVSGATALIGAGYDSGTPVEARIGDTYYATLAEAIAVGGEVKLLKDIELTETITIAAGQKVTLDLNGKIISGISSEEKASCLISNKGDLTIKDSVGGGKITSEVQNPDLKDIPGYANNTINNGGTLTVLSGTIENTGEGAACYPIDTNSGSANTKVIIKGGKIDASEESYAIRLWAGSTTYTNEVIIEGGELTGYRAVWVQLPGSDSKQAPYASLTVKGGTLTSVDETYNSAIYCRSWGQSYANTSVTILDGVINGDVALSGPSNVDMNPAETVSISGGTFNSINSGVYTYSTHLTGFITGGTFAIAPDAAYLADGYVAVANDDGTYTVVDYTDLVITATSDSKYFMDFGDGTYILGMPAGATATVDFTANMDLVNVAVGAKGNPIIDDKMVGTTNHEIVNGRTVTYTFTCDKAVYTDQFKFVVTTRDGKVLAEVPVTIHIHYALTFVDGEPSHVTGFTGEGKAQSFPAEPTKDGYTFLGWFDAETGGNEITADTVFPAGNATAYAQWGRNVAITTQPVDAAVVEGETFTFTVNAVGDGLTYKWYYKDYGTSEFVRTYTFSGNTYEAVMNDYRNGRQVYCEITDACGNTVTTDVVTATMKVLAEIVTQPADVTVANGETFTFTVNAIGDGLTYKWYYKDYGTSEFVRTYTFSGNTYEAVMNAYRNGRQVYCEITDAYGNTVTTDVVTATMKAAEAVFAAQIGDVKYDTLAAAIAAVQDGETIVLIKDIDESVIVVNKEIYFFIDSDGHAFDPMNGIVAGDDYNRHVSGSPFDDHVCVFDFYAKNYVEIITQPESVTVAEGETLTVTVEATGDGLTYEWYYKNSYESAFAKTNAFTGNTYSVQMNEARNGRQIYCKVTDAYGNTVTTDTVTLSMEMNNVEIIDVIYPDSVAEGEDFTITVEATGDGLTYEWFYKNTYESAFAKTGAFTGNSYSVQMNEVRNGRQVYCEITDAYGNTATTEIITLAMEIRVENNVEIIDVIYPDSVAEGEDFTITVEATGDGLTYEWFYKNTYESSFAKTGAFTGNTYSVQMNEVRNGRQVYCKITDAYGNTVITEIITLTMETGVEIIDVSYPESVAEGETFTITVEATGEGLTYEWYYKNTYEASFAKTGAFTGNTYSVQMNAARNGRQVYCEITDAYGNIVFTDVITLSMQ